MKSLRFSRTTLFPLLLLVASFFFAQSCDKKDGDTGQISYPLETARLVKLVTNGVIAPDDPIRVRFATPVITREQVGSQLKASVFNFEPTIDGIATWEDRDLLVFQPNQSLPLRSQYQGRLDLKALFPLHKDRESLSDLPFRFNVAGREITHLSTDFELVKPADPRQIYAVGDVAFSQPLTLAELQDNSALTRNGKSLNLQWTEKKSGTAYSFRSDALERGERTADFVLTLDGGKLGLPEDLKRPFVLPALQDLAFLNAEAHGETGNATVEIKFSDELDRQMDLNGLVRVEPPVNFTLSKSGNSLILSGDFHSGEKYDLILNKGLRSRFGTTLTQNITHTIHFETLKPRLEFVSDGSILPTANQRRIRFRTLNVRAVFLQVKRVFENNLGQFLQTEQLKGDRDRRYDFNYSYVNRVGEVVKNDTLQIGEAENTWQTFELDFRELIDQADQGLYLISLSFDRDNMIYPKPEEGDNSYYYDEGHPYSWSYLRNFGQVFKPVMVSDIGLLAKGAHERFVVYATDIESANPISGAQVILKSYQNQVISEGRTDSRGRVAFEEVRESVFYIEANYQQQRSAVKLNEMAWNLSTFDTDGVESAPGGINAFIYTDRGVYRPGDMVHLSVVARNDAHTFPDNHPVSVRIYNPRNQKRYEETHNDGKDGFYAFSFDSKPDDLTGTWRVEVVAGSKTFHHDLKIETVVPFRLKVNLSSETKRFSPGQGALELDLNSTYLFGNPAANLDAEVEMNLSKSPLKAPKYDGFVFDHEAREFRSVQTNLYRGRLDADGNAIIRYNMPTLQEAPSRLMATFTAKVFEKGGRPNTGILNIPVDPFPYYVGLEKPELDWGYARVGATLAIPTILLDGEGQPAAGRQLTYRIYQGEEYWWYDFDNLEDYQMRFKRQSSTKLLKQESVLSQSLPARIDFAPDKEGYYLVEVQDGPDGHMAGFFFYASSWGRGAAGKDAGVLALKTDKEEYRPGETATLTFPAPREGGILFTLERGSEILDERWYAAGGGEEMNIEFAIREDMAPNCYATVAILQPHAQTANDRPIRLYGVVPVKVTAPETQQLITLETPASLRPNEPFTVKLATSDGKPTQFTLAVVDEGLLDITRFKTPDPWAHFFRKIRLGVASYDLFNEVIGAHKGDVLRVFSIGGGMMEAYRDSQMGDKETQRFKPVALFRGPLKTDNNGKASISFDMPNYVGSVRVMAVAARGNTYGSAQKTVPVKTELMAVTSLPRVLGPGDRFTMPATVFAMEKNIGDVKVTLDLQGPLKPLSEKQTTLSFSAVGEKDWLVDLEADTAIGPAKIVVTASNGRFKSVIETDIVVRSTSPRVTETLSQGVRAGERVSLRIPNRGLKGSNQARIAVRNRPNMDFGKRLGFLIRYPYGCIEQTTSSAFPQLYLKTFMGKKGDSQTARRIDDNINNAILRLRRFQLPGGAFSYWPGSRYVSDWGTNYAGHFLLEAKKLGYNVPEDMLNAWKTYLKNNAMSTRENLKTRVYRAYLLALAGESPRGPLNLLRENNLKDMDNADKWMLASGYQLGGNLDMASRISRESGTSARDYWEFSGTYGSALRDEAMILQAQVLFKNWTEADRIASRLLTAIASQNWYSTQTTAFMLLATGQYLEALRGVSDQPARIAGKIILPDGGEVPFDTEDYSFELPIESGFGKDVVVELSASSTVERGFVYLDWSGLPLKSDLKTASSGLTLSVSYYNEDGQPINPSNLRQGTSFWARYQVGQENARIDIEEVALLQVLPSGWEIENTRLANQELPGWMSSWPTGREEYLDIRDDRIMWFFDMPRHQRGLEFVVKLNAVTQGEYDLPGTLVEAMYSNEFEATVAGSRVTVSAK